MDLPALARAVEVLMSPLGWGGQDVWLDESLRRVRDVFGAASKDIPADPHAELEALLHLPGDKPGWLRAMLDSPAGESRGNPLPPIADASLLTVVSLRCALIAGLAALQQLRSSMNTLGHAFDDAETGMAVFGNGGLREVARNSRLNELLEEEPACQRLMQLVALQARRAATSSEGFKEDFREADLPGGLYRLIASGAAAGTLLPEAAVIILVERLTPALPTTRELRIAFGLRGREPQVALLAAEGLSNADIAERLRLSAHTVRHYLERVLDRLGLHSRKALALHLMANSQMSPPAGFNRSNNTHRPSGDHTG
jgi:DNA-binding CsgD family transcriptional regulator